MKRAFLLAGVAVAILAFLGLWYWHHTRGETVARALANKELFGKTAGQEPSLLDILKRTVDTVDTQDATTASLPFSGCPIQRVIDNYGSPTAVGEGCLLGAEKVHWYGKAGFAVDQEGNIRAVAYRLKAPAGSRKEDVNMKVVPTRNGEVEVRFCRKIFDGDYILESGGE